MKKSFSTIRRFLLPVTILIIISALMLAERESSQQIRAIEEAAQVQNASLIRLLSVTDALVSDQVTAALQLLHERADALGSPGIKGKTWVDGRLVPNLVFGKQPQANHFELVDSVTKVLGGTATLFVKSGDSFVRVSTNVQKSDGSRAVGTILDPQGKALAAIKQGKPFYGVVEILGEAYITGYEPMRDASGNTIGAWYVGYKVDMRVLREAVEKTRYLQTGFSAVLDKKKQIHFLSAHVKPETAMAILRDRPQEWTIISKDIPQWDFTVQIAYPKSEAKVIGLARSLYVITLGSLLAVALIAIIVWQLWRHVLRPLGGDPAVASELVRRISAGDLHDDNLQANEGTLMANMLKMRGNLRETVNTLQQNAEKLSLSASVFEHAHDGIFITDNNQKIIDINAAFTRITGYNRDEALGQSPQQLRLAADDQGFFPRVWGTRQSVDEWRGETNNLSKDGKPYIGWLDLFTVRNAAGEISHYVGICSDITLLKQQQQNLEHMAYYDALTQLPNRTMFYDRLQQMLARARRSGELMAICYLDLDGFKPVNDNLGHEAGDLLLQELARRTLKCVRADDTVARLGGDEFAILLASLQNPEECVLTLDRILASLLKPYRLGAKTVTVSASIGYTMFPQDDAGPDGLLRHADQAMYQAKLNGGNCYQVFDLQLKQVDSKTS